MLTKLKDHNAAKLADVLGDFYREAMPHSMEIARFEWQTILAFMGASDEQIRDVQLRIGGVWR